MRLARHLCSNTLYSGGQIENLYMCGHTNVICTLTLAYFCVSSVFDSVPNFTKQNPLVYRSLPVSS